MKKILFISTRFPFPLDGGAKVRSFDILKSLSKKNKIELVCLGKKNEKHKKNLPFCRNIKVFNINFFNKIINTIFSIFKFEPLQNGFCLSNEMKNYINSVEHNYDSIICHLLRSSQYLPDKFKKKKILEMSDLQSFAYQKLVDQLSNINPLKYLYIYENFMVKKYEKKIFKNFDKIVFISDKDATEAKKNIFKKNKVCVVEIGPKKFLSNQFKYKKKNNKIIFIGNINFFPNILACVDFAKNALVKINLKYPKVKFHVIGNIGYLHKIFLRKYKNVVVHGRVNNLKKIIPGSICALCNVKVSTGFQNKIITYMSYGIPTILSKYSFINTKFKKNKEVLTFQNDQELIKKVFNLIENKKISERLSNNVQIFMEKKYNAEKKLSKYEKII
jgi:hypothetical protein